MTFHYFLCSFSSTQSAAYNSNHSKAMHMPESSTPADLLPNMARYIPTTMDNSSAKSSLSPNSLRMRISVTPEPLAHTESSTSKRPQRYNAQQAAQIITQQLTMKSPGKSPGKSPRQMEMLRQRSETTRGRPRGARNSGTGRGGSAASASRSTSTSARGGRGRGRAQNIVPMPNMMYSFAQMQPIGGIQDKLQGTVYDFDNDEDSASSVGDLKSMRDRGRSLEARHQHQPESYRLHDASESLKFATANNHKMSRMVYGSEVRDLRPPSVSPIHTNNLAITQNLPSAASQATPLDIDPAIPVDMRTYGNIEHSATQPLPHKLRMTYDYQQQSYTKVGISPYSASNRTTAENDADDQPDQDYAAAATSSKGSTSKTVTSASTSADDYSSVNSWRKSHLNRYFVIFFFC